MAPESSLQGKNKNLRYQKNFFYTGKKEDLEFWIAVPKREKERLHIFCLVWCGTQRRGQHKYTENTESKQDATSSDRYV